MGGLRRFVELRLKAQTGLSSGVVLWALIALLSGTITFVFLLVTAFIWLAERYDALTAALVLAGVSLLIGIVALLLSLHTHRRIIEQAELALAAQKTAFRLDPTVLGLMVQVGRGIGWRKVAALLPVVIVGAGIGMQMLGRQRAKDEGLSDEEKDNYQRSFRRAA